MRKFTKGPWSAGSSFVTAANDAIICQFFNKREEDFANAYANAQLTAAGPDMFEALEKTRTFIANGIALGYIRMPDPETRDPALDTPKIIDAALAKARGQ